MADTRSPEAEVKIKASRVTAGFTAEAGESEMKEKGTVPGCNPAAWFVTGRTKTPISVKMNSSPFHSMTLRTCGAPPCEPPEINSNIAEFAVDPAFGLPIAAAESTQKMS